MKVSSESILIFFFFSSVPLVFLSTSLEDSSFEVSDVETGLRIARLTRLRSRRSAKPKILII